LAVFVINCHHTFGKTGNETLAATGWPYGRHKILIIVTGGTISRCLERSLCKRL